MKWKFCSICSLFFHGFLLAQSAHVTLLSHIMIPENASSIWGFTDSQNKEYALLGTVEGVRIYSLLDPTQPKEIAFIQCTNSSWRELKSFGQYAYVVTEGGDGLLVINLSDPNQITYQFLKQVYSTKGDTQELRSSHTIFIDEKGYIYLAGSSNGGYSVIILDAQADAWSPVFVHTLNEQYFHEVYVSQDTMYAAEIFTGVFSIYDIRDRQHPVRINDQQTANHFTHTACLENYRKIFYSADEVDGGSIESWDVNDVLQIKKLDQYQVNSPQVNRLIPHNVFYKDSFIFVSYYTEGLRILDCRKADNLIEVGYYDTYPQNDVGFHGCWSVFPYFKSGICIASDIENGMYILRFDSNSAAYLEGNVYDQSTGKKIANANITLKQKDQIYTEYSNLKGIYKTGTAASGEVELIANYKGYHAYHKMIQIIQDSIIHFDIYLEPLILHQIQIKAIDSLTLKPIPQCMVRIWNEDFIFESNTDQNGFAHFTDVPEDKYSYAAGIWAYQNKAILNANLNSDQNLEILLSKGYRDDFIFDESWTQEKVDSLVTWKRSDFSEFKVPFGNYPSKDLPDDIGTSCYYTDNFDKIFNEFRIHDHIYLRSPLMDFSGFDEADLKYYAWAYGGGNGAIKECFLTLGKDTIYLEQIPEFLKGNFNPQSHYIIDLKEKQKDSVQFVFHLYNNPDSLYQGTSLKAALDRFEMQGILITSNKNISNSGSLWSCFPNPFFNFLTIENRSPVKTQFELQNILGQIELSFYLMPDAKLNVPTDQFIPGVYMLKNVQSHQSKILVK